MKAAFHTLGCKVNQYETEAIKQQFQEAGYDIVGDKEIADVYVINTCSVTSLADRKSRQFIRKSKKLNDKSIVVVTGCYAQVKKDEVLAIDEVDIVTGTNEKNRIIELIDSFREKNAFVFGNCDVEEKISSVRKFEDLGEYVELGLVTSQENRTRAYVKIQEGCNRFCSYCIIPYARGNVRSRELDDVIDECKMLISKGMKEIVLTGINTALCENLEEILAYLDAMEGEFRVRLSSLEPTVINADYVKNILKYKRLCHHLHLSLQAGSNSILHAMNRRYTAEEYLKIVEVIREFDQNYCLTTDIIVGFPGETEEDFEESVNMVKLANYGKVHTFKYSRRSGTKAYDMPNQIDEQVKKIRSEKLIKESQVVSENFYRQNIGMTTLVLFEEYQEDIGCITGYTDNYIKVYMKCTKEESRKYTNNFVKIILNEICLDGMSCFVV